MASESSEMHRTVNSFMVLGMGGRGAAGLRILRNAKDFHYVRDLKAPATAAFGSRIIRHAWDCRHFHGFGSGREGGGWVQNQKSCKRLSAFSCLWK